MSLTHLSLILFCVSTILIGQILFKYVGLALYDTGLIGLLHQPKIATVFMISLVLYAFSTLLWIIVLGHVPLGRAYMFMALSFALMPFLAHFLFGEALNIRLLIGSFFIVFGIILATYQPSS